MNPVPFEQEFPIAGQILADICEQNARAKAKGKRVVRWLLNPPDPVRSTKVGRNEPCPCNSGSKYKKCCGR
jgi:uncharacterized protein YecA (UPF0149 family)